MEHSDQKHEKVRFRKDEIVRLKSLPSASVQDRFADEPHLRSRVLPAFGWALAVLFAAIVVLPVCLYGLSLAGVGNERLRAEAEAALTALAGMDIDAELGSPRLSVDGSRFLAIEVNDVRLTGAASGLDIVDAGTIRFGLRFAPLLGGNVRLGSAGIEDARITLASLPSRDGGSWTADIVGSDGLVEPGLVMAAVFRSLHRAFDTFDMGETKSIDLTNVELVFPPELRVRSLSIEKAHIGRSGEGQVVFDMTANVDGRPLRLSGSADRDETTRRIAAFDAALSIDPTYLSGPFTANAKGRDFAIMRVGAGAEMRIEGDEMSGGAGRFSVNADLKAAELGFGNGDKLTGEGSLALSFDAENRKVEIKRATLSVGRSRYDFHGAVGPARAVDGKAPAYRYELVSDGSMVAPGGSSEADLVILARLAGRYDPAAQVLTADNIGVRTGRGEVMGKAMVSFVENSTPGVDLVLSVPEMPSGHVKQLWPWFAATGAQNWAHANLFGGTVRNSTLSMSVEPGRIGNGVPLQAHEISGHFEVDGARFDVTGKIPPVRDAVGIVDFQGTDVDIRLASGTVYLPTGRTVAASNGVFVIRRGERPPVIGDLDIDVAGEADAIGELASYKPIDAMRHLALAPGDLSGKVSGNVKARIPLQKNVVVADLGWRVKLSYSNLSISKPFEGQTVTDAEGTIEVEPSMALIRAEAKLNGMPASLDIAEPLGGGEEGRVRDITLTLDDQAREKLAPGLNAMLSGSVKVNMIGTEKTGRKIVADLSGARLSLPWAGWSKGVGIPATVSFGLDTEGPRTRLSDIRLSGKSFLISGTAAVTKSGLASARFDSVKLNRNDDVRVDIERSGGGYAISVKGKSLDARALVKQLLADPEVATSTVKSTPISLSADLDSVSGFDGETLSGVSIDYKGTGATVASLKVTGATKSGGTVEVSNGPAGGGRTVRMNSSDAGAILRFLDIYPHMEGGRIALDLTASGDGPLKGRIEARDFALVNEPRLRSMVSTPASGDNRSLNQAIRKDIDTSRVTFERGFALLEKGPGYLSIERGVLRGPLIGTTFQGSLYDAKGNMAITGTFMPAYGINRLFGEIPLLGLVLGNGRDRGLIGITYKVAGDAKSPKVMVNPISAIAPGIFRSIFEFN